MSSAENNSNGRYDLSSRQKTFLGVSKDQFLKGWFGGNAMVALIVLGLITIFLFKEGAGFFGQYRKQIELYRRSGLEYVQIMADQQEALTQLNRFLGDIRGSRMEALAAEGKDFMEIKKIVSEHDSFYYGVEDLINPLRRAVMDANEVLIESRNLYVDMQNLREHKQNLLALGKVEEAEQLEIQDVDLAMMFSIVKDGEADFIALNEKIGQQLTALIAKPPVYEDEELNSRMKTFTRLAAIFVDELPSYSQRLQDWNRDLPVGIGAAFSGFVFGRDWVTNSSIQDWYGLWPLFSGSLLVGSIAMVIAVPLGVGAAVYVNQVAGSKEQNFIKPYIEFISAIPSVVIGFFGIAIFGEFVRTVSNWDFMSWVPFFPLNERLTAFTAGCLLALMAIPTIFTLAEDAINNVPKAFKEASLAIGATRWQTVIRIIVPTSLSGIISAVLLGFGRVIGETMVVLLCAGNRIQIPELTEGLGAFFQPVHTMTGIIAQELGEVVYGSIHYRALFMVGMMLFLISLLINFVAQKIVLKYQTSRG